MTWWCSPCEAEPLARPEPAQHLQGLVQAIAAAPRHRRPHRRPRTPRRAEIPSPAPNDQPAAGEVVERGGLAGQVGRAARGPTASPSAPAAPGRCAGPRPSGPPTDRRPRTPDRAGRGCGPTGRRRPTRPLLLPRRGRPAATRRRTRAGWGRSDRSACGQRPGGQAAPSSRATKRRRHSTEALSAWTLTSAVASSGQHAGNPLQHARSSAPMALSNRSTSSAGHREVVVAPDDEREQRRHVVDRRAEQQQDVVEPGLVVDGAAHGEGQVEAGRHPAGEHLGGQPAGDGTEGVVVRPRPRRRSRRSRRRAGPARSWARGCPGRGRTCRCARTGSGRCRGSCRSSASPTRSSAPRPR